VIDHVVHLGDCLDPVTGLASLPDKSVDHVICDPPYSEHVSGNSVRGDGHRAGGKLRALGFAHLTEETMKAAALEFARIVRRWALVFSDVESGHLWRAALEAGGLELIRSGVWVKEFPTPQMTGDRPAIGVELITIAHPKGRKRWNGGGRPAVWTCPTAYRDGDPITHTTQKPTRLMSALVRDFTDRGELICDPFSGSGTTGAAAKQMGRRFIGWELDETHARNAQARLLVARDQLPIFAEGS
jgi:site-specific DNA-methyltransferase (adenine-specific)